LKLVCPEPYNSVVTDYTLHSYLLTSVQTKHRIGPELLVRFGV